MQCLFPEAYIRLLTSILEHPFPESMDWSTTKIRQTRSQDTFAQTTPSLWSLRHQHNCADHSECLCGQNHNFIPFAWLRLLRWWRFYQKVSFESTHITMCTECKIVTATLIYADHLNSVTSAINVHNIKVIFIKDIWHSYLPIHVVTHVFKVSE